MEPLFYGNRMTKTVKKRLDVLMLDRGLAESREQAQRMIMAGLVRVGEQVLDKPGKELAADAEIRVEGDDIPYVSRGGLKLEKAMRAFEIDVTGRTAIDVGASTGGFTDCLLQHGAKQVYAVDVGYGQLDWKLRQDSRVVNIEKENIRYLDARMIPEKVDLAVVDVSFISLKIVIPKVLEFLSPEGIVIALVKPQFEVGRGQVGKGGVVREKEKHDMVLTDLEHFMAGLGLKVGGITDSPVLGAKGNREFLMFLRQ